MSDWNWNCIDDYQKEVTEDREQHIGSWFIYAVLSAIFASLTAILGKIGISGIDSNLGTAIRTSVVLAMAWLMVLLKRKTDEVCKIEKKGITVHYAVRICNRSFLAMLLQSIAGGTSEHSCAN